MLVTVGYGDNCPLNGSEDGGIVLEIYTDKGACDDWYSRGVCGAQTRSADALTLTRRREKKCRSANGYLSGRIFKRHSWWGKKIDM